MMETPSTLPTLSATLVFINGNIIGGLMANYASNSIMQYTGVTMWLVAGTYYLWTATKRDPK